MSLGMEAVVGLEVWDIQLGFDEGYLGYWLTIAKSGGPTDELSDYIFHNMKDVPGVSMTFGELKERLASFGIGLPHEMADALVYDACQSSYLHEIEAGRLSPKHDLDEFKDIYHRVYDGRPGLGTPRRAGRCVVRHRRLAHPQARGRVWKLRRWLAPKPGHPRNLRG